MTLKILSIVVASAIYIFMCPNYMHVNNAIYSISQINLYDDSIFAGNIAIGQHNFSSKFILDYIIGSAMKFLQVDWTVICMFLVYLGFVILAWSTTETAFNIANKKKNGIFLTVIFTVFITLAINTGFPGYESFHIVRCVGLGTGYLFVMLALSKLVNDDVNWNAVWLLLAIATLFHIHEGLYGFCIAFVIAICRFTKGKFSLKSNSLFIIFMFMMTVSIIPGILVDSGGGYDNFERVY